MSRYENTNIIRGKVTSDRKQGVNALSTTIYKQIPKRDSDIYLVSQAGDRLDNLANQFYGNPTLWWYIAQANDLFSINLEPNTSLRIPADLEYVDTEER